MIQKNGRDCRGDGIRLCVSADDVFRHLAFGGTQVHGLFLNVAVGLGFLHFQFVDQQPFGPVDQSDLLHFKNLEGIPMKPVPQPCGIVSVNYLITQSQIGVLQNHTFLQFQNP